MCVLTERKAGETADSGRICIDNQERKARETIWHSYGAGALRKRQTN